ncbi:MAG: Zn-ribbon domain-containing OB-fold protein [Candidatus Binatia bacterium]
MVSAKKRVPAIDGWFTMDEAEPRLIGRRGKDSGSFFFPPSLAVSANPGAPFEEREEVLLGRRGRVWSWATNHYQPPEPYLSPDPFVPYTVVAVELEREKMVVLGQLSGGVDPSSLSVGDEVELVLGTLYEDDENEYVVWRWQPVDG